MTPATLQKDWSVSLGATGQGRHFYRGAVCPDGSYYFSDGLGRIVRFAANSSILADSHVEGAQAIAIACDSESHLLAASYDHVVVVGANERALSVLDSFPLPKQIQTAFGIAPAGKNRYLVLGLNNSIGCLNLIDKNGNLLRSYDSASTTPDSASLILNGTVALNPASGHILHVPENPYVFLEYDPAAGIVHSTPRNDPEFQAPSGAGAGQSRGDRVLRTTFLPGGNVLAQVVKRTTVVSPSDGGQAMQTSSYLELFDSGLHLKATGIDVEGFGQLQGAAGDGSLYFNLISTPNGIQVIKAHLVAQ